MRVAGTRSCAPACAAFTAGADLTDAGALRAVTVEARLEADGLAAGIADLVVKAELRANTDRALALGVSGVPTVLVGGAVFWGDDRLEAAAAALAGSELGADTGRPGDPTAGRPGGGAQRQRGAHGSW